MEDILFSCIICCFATNRAWFRDCLESVASQDFSAFELIVIDDNPGNGLYDMVSEFFPDDGRVCYRHLRLSRGRAWSMNYAIENSRGRLFFFLNQHSRLAENAFSVVADAYEKDGRYDVFYSDHDELDGPDRVNPHFLPDFNVELLRQKNYIGDSFVLKREAYIGLGTFRKELSFFPEWEYLLRLSERRRRIAHIKKLLVHRRPQSIEDELGGRATGKELLKKLKNEASAVVLSSIRRAGADARIVPLSEPGVVSVEYDNSDFDIKRDDVLVLKDRGVSVLTRGAAAKLYGTLRQKDVAIVGCRWAGAAFSIDNAGFVFDKNGISFPACHGQSIFSKGYDDRIALRHDVSAVDLSYCLIDKKFYRRSGGLDPSLSGRDMMLDLCLRATTHGLRVVYDPSVTALHRRRETESSELSNRLLMEKHGETIALGDPYYNVNMPIGLSNYVL